MSNDLVKKDGDFSISEGNHRPQRINPSTGPFEWGYNSNMSGNPLSLLLL